MNISNYFDYAVGMLFAYLPKLVLAAVTLWIGFWLIKKIVNIFSQTLAKKEIEVSLTQFLGSMITIILKILLILSVVSILGVETTSFVAILAAAGFAIGMALQGSLGNFAGGVVILIFKPFKVGDLIEAQGFIGVVDSIQVFNTILKTPDNKTIIIPNGGLSSGAMTNFSTEPIRRVDLTIGIGYGDDIKKAKDLILELISTAPGVLQDPAPAVMVSELADSSVNFTVRPWAASEDYWNVYFDLHERIKLALDANNISIPFPQADVHLIQQ
ncbi:MAG: mechanosensitive ion channel [Chlorobi bacterium]|nr:mechanosensitive ion channel [Chlorobiota bacterium]